MGARIAAMAHHPNDGNHAGTNLPTPFNALPFCLSVSRSYLSLSLSISLSLTLSPFSSLFLPDASRAIFCWHFASIPTLPLSLIQPPLSPRLPYLGALFRPARNFHTAHFAVLFNVRHHPYVRPYVCPFIRAVFASVSRLTHLRPISLLARCKTMMNTDDRSWDLAPRYAILSQPVAVCHWWGLY